MVFENFRTAFESAVERFAGGRFVTCYGSEGKLTKTFSEFAADVDAASARLAQASEAITVTIGENSYAHLVFLAASLLCGKTICPINPREEVRRIRLKIGALGEPPAVWCEDPALAADLGAEVFSLSPGPGLGVHRDFPAERPVALIFTSGSSGESKIVEWSERALLANIHDLIEHHRLSERRTIATPLPVYHVNALGFSFLSSLLSGGHLILFERFSAPWIEAAVKEDGAEIFSLTPTHLNLMTRRPRDFAAGDWSKVRYAVSAAAPLSCALAEKFQKLFGVRVIQGYGLSEGVNFSATLPVDLSDFAYDQAMLRGPLPSVGTALRGNEILVVKENGEPAAEGETGELNLRGACLMRGYRGAEPLGGATFATGDLGYFKEIEGQKFFFISGRKRDVIKRYGETVSLRDVDELFRPFCVGGDVIAAGFPNELAGEELGLVVRENIENFEERFLAYVKEQVPAMYRPRVVILSKRELRTPSAKPQRWRFRESFTPFASTAFGSRIVFKSDTE